MTVRHVVEHSIWASNGESTTIYLQILRKSVAPPPCTKRNWVENCHEYTGTSILKRHFIRPRYWQLRGLRCYSQSGSELRANSTRDVWQESHALYIGGI